MGGFFFFFCGLEFLGNALFEVFDLRLIGGSKFFFLGGGSFFFFRVYM